jgi:hypothetical protein
MSAPVLVYLEWKDHCGDGGWANVDTFHGPALIRSVGWVAKEDDEGISIAACLADNVNREDESPTGNLQYILKCCIVKRTVLKCPK